MFQCSKILFTCLVHDVLKNINSKKEQPYVLKDRCVVLLDSARNTELHDSITHSYSPDVDGGLTLMKSEMQLPDAQFQEAIVPSDSTDQV